MTEKTTKAVNYTAEQTTAMVADYAAGTTVELIAQNLGKSVRSVVAKLSREGVYIAKAKESAEHKATKEDLVAKIAAIVGVPPNELESLNKATKGALETLVEYASTR